MNLWRRFLKNIANYIERIGECNAELLYKTGRRSIENCRTLAKKMGNRYVGTEHLLVALRKVYRTVAGQVLAQNGVKEETWLKLLMNLFHRLGRNRK